MKKGKKAGGVEWTDEQRRAVASLIRHQAELVCGKLPKLAEGFVREGSVSELLCWAERIACWHRPFDVEDLFAERYLPVRRARFAARMEKRFGELSEDVRISIRYLEPWELVEWEPLIDTARRPEGVVIRTAAQKLRLQGYWEGYLEGIRDPGG